MNNEATSKRKVDKQIVKVVARRIADLSKDKWMGLPKDERRLYVLTARRALAGVRSAEKRMEKKSMRSKISSGS